MRFVLPLLLAAAALAPLELRAAPQPLEIGDRVPRITAADQDGNAVDFVAATAQGYTLVYFYPQAGTPGCTAEACSLRDQWEGLRQRGIAVIGVSLDSIAAQHDFHARNNLPFRLVADPEGVVASSFGVAPMANGKDRREAFLIHDGAVIWRQLEVNPETAAADFQAAYDAKAGGGPAH